MAKIAIGFGSLLTLIGVGSYFGTGQSSITALIPAFFGLPIALLGVAALKESLRKHAMHAAVALSLLGFLGTASSFPKAITLAIGGAVDRPFAVVVQFVMALGCAAFVGMGVWSFVQARRQRQQAAA